MYPYYSGQVFLVHFTDEKIEGHRFANWTVGSQSQ